MGQLLHGSARTTAAVRRAIQHSQDSIATLADRYDLNPKTVAKRLNVRSTARPIPKSKKTMTAASRCVTRSNTSS
jgi:hypothetical protein